MHKALNIPFVALLFLVAAPTRAQYRGPYKGPTVEKNRISFQLGYFTPQGSSDYWRDKEVEFTGRASDFADFSGGIGYTRFLNERLAFVALANFYEGDATQAYLDFVDDRGAPIRHTTTLEIASFELGLLFHFASRDAPVIPYAGFAGGLYSWRLRESGDFINFSDPELPIFSTTFVAEGDTFGYSLIAGLDIPLSRNWSVLTEVRWQDADPELGGDFPGFGKLDLSGWNLRAGMSWGF